MVTCILYGKENENEFYVQVCCNEQHYGQPCSCKSLGEKLSRKKAKKIAYTMAKKMRIPVFKA